MTYFVRILMLLGLSAVLMACAGQPAADQPAPVQRQAPAPLSGPPASNPNSAQTAPPAETINIPPNAQWTIFCATYRGPNHAIYAQQVKESVLQSTPLKDWYIIHGESESTLYHGFYRTIDDPKDPKEVARAKKDRAAIDAMVDSMRNRPFAQAMFVPLDAADPAAPPEWNLTNTKGYWSVAIAVYKDSPQRKQYAVDAVVAARAQGVEAYYYHGEVGSYVCIGVWPREAVREQDAGIENKAASSDDRPLLIMPRPIPGMESARDRDGRPLKVLAPRVEILDPTLKKTLRDFPTFATNGMEMYSIVTDPRTRKKIRKPDPSFFFAIPHNDSSSFANTTEQQPQAQPQGIPRRVPRRDSGLRSIDNP